MAKLTPPINDQDHVLGPENAPVTLVEYGDFQCPHCGAAYPILQQIIAEMGSQMRFAFRHFPLTESHEYAEVAAEAAEAAAAQGEFWAMHDIIFRNQGRLDMDGLREFAQAIGLDLKAFDEALMTHRYEDRVQSDFSSGVRSGVNGTPTLFVNGQRYDGPVEHRSLLHALKAVADEAKA